MLRFNSPTSKKLINQRDSLLQSCLRPSDLQFTIQSEYPIVLSPENETLSICAFLNNKLIAHANLWPRIIAKPRSISDQPSPPTYKVGLIGNVATDEKHRGRGYMRELISRLLLQAKNQGLSAVFLWSDLDIFYQKMGFSSFSRERRLTFDLKHLEKAALKLGHFHLHDSKCRIRDHDFQRMMTLRPHLGYTLRRHPREFRQLLSIPDTHLLTLSSPGSNETEVLTCCKSHQNLQIHLDTKHLASADITTNPQSFIESFAIVGKGYDMKGVVHEWGGTSPDWVLNLLRNFLDLSKWSKVLLLAPEKMEDDWHEGLLRFSNKTSIHNMGYCNPIDETLPTDLKSALESTFIWGLDSI